MAKEPNEMQKLVGNICSQTPVARGPVLLEDIQNAINDDLETGETTLLSRKEVADILETHREGGLWQLVQLANLDFGRGCHPKAPLFETDVKLKILRMKEKAVAKATPVDFDAAFEIDRWRMDPKGVPTERFLDALAKTMTFESEVDPLANKLRYNTSYNTVQGRIGFD